MGLNRTWNCGIKGMEVLHASPHLRVHGQPRTRAHACMQRKENPLKGQNMGTNTTEKNTKVIIITSLKGGVAKTTNTLHAAAALAELGRKSLVIDFDSTGGATSLLGVPDTGPWPSAYEFITGTGDPEDCILTSGGEEGILLPAGIDLIPGSEKLEGLDSWLTENKYITQAEMLLRPISAVRGLYDYVFIDLPPRVAPTTVPSMRVSDYVILCAVPEDAAVRYLVRTWDDIQEARNHGFAVEVLGILLSSIKRPMTRFARHLVGEVQDQLRDADGRSLKFETDISLGVSMSESQGMHQTLFQYEPSHKICEQYRAVVREMEARIRERTGVELTPQAPLQAPGEPSPEQPVVPMTEVGNA